MVAMKAQVLAPTNAATKLLRRESRCQQMQRIQALATELGWDAETLKAQLKVLSGDGAQDRSGGAGRAKDTGKEGGERKGERQDDSGASGDQSDGVDGDTADGGGSADVAVGHKSKPLIT